MAVSVVANADVVFSGTLLKEVIMRILIMISLATLFSGLLYASWSVDVLDDEGVTGYYTAIRTGSDGFLHVTYRDQTDNALMHAFQSGSGWEYEVIDERGCYFMAMVLDGQDIPRVTFWDMSIDKICHVQWDEDEWVTDTIASAFQSGYHYPISDIEIDSSENSHVVWYDGSGVNYAVRQSAGIWSISVVDSIGNTGISPSLGLDQDIPHVAYGNIDDGHLYYATMERDAWLIEVVDPCEDADMTSIEIDSSGMPHILYYGIRDVCDSPTYTIGYASRESSGWEIEAAVTGAYNYPARPQGLCLDNNDNPHICFLYADYGGYLNYRYRNSSGWHNEWVDGAGSGYDSAICIDSSGNPNISYFFWGSEEDLRWAHRGSSGIWSSETSLITEQNIVSISSTSNPIEGSASIVLNMLVAGTASIRVYDIAGRSVYELPGLELSQGTHELSLGNFGEGLYFCVVELEHSFDRTSFVVLE